MISVVTNAINFIVSIVWSLFTAASQAGQLIVAVLGFVLSICTGVAENFISFLTILYVDNEVTFKEEIPNTAWNLFVTVSDNFLFLYYGVLAMLTDLYNKFNAVFNLCFLVIDYGVKTVVDTFFLLKSGFILIGNSLWLIVTFIPIQLPLLFKFMLMVLWDFLLRWLIKIYLNLLKITNFLTDVPLESFIGIISAIVIVRLYVNFKEIILSQLRIFYWTLVRKMLYLYYLVYNYFTNSETRLITQLVRNQRVERRDMLNHNLNDLGDSSGSADALCVICQERQKCVLTLPCRHVCLCRECCLTLYNYQRTCPICRTFIYHSVTVYL